MEGGLSVKRAKNEMRKWRTWLPCVWRLTTRLKTNKKKRKKEGGRENAWMCVSENNKNSKGGVMGRQLWPTSANSHVQLVVTVWTTAALFFFTVLIFYISRLIHLLKQHVHLLRLSIYSFIFFLLSREFNNASGYYYQNGKYLSLCILRCATQPPRQSLLSENRWFTFFQNME